MQHAKQLNHRTRYTIIPSQSVVLDQDGKTFVLSYEEIIRLFMEVTGDRSTDDPEEYDATKGCQG